MLKKTEKVARRNEDVGLRCARIIHNNVFESQSYYAYERSIAMKSKMQDVGCQHHSRKFSAEFVKSMAALLSARLSSILLTPLECTGGSLRPISVSADKGTLKRLSSNP